MQGAGVVSTELRCAKGRRWANPARQMLQRTNVPTNLLFSHNESVLKAEWDPPRECLPCSYNLSSFR